MKFLLDANILSEATKPNPSPAVMRWLARHEVESCTSAVVMGEIELGLLLMPHGLRRRQIMLWFHALAEGMRVLPFDEAAASCWAGVVARLQEAGLRIPVQDSMIAATALVRGLTVVTRNVRDFERTGVALVNPFE